MMSTNLFLLSKINNTIVFIFSSIYLSLLLQSFLRTTSNILDQKNRGSWKALEENNETKVGAISDLGFSNIHFCEKDTHSWYLIPVVDNKSFRVQSLKPYFDTCVVCFLHVNISEQHRRRQGSKRRR